MGRSLFIPIQLSFEDDLKMGSRKSASLTDKIFTHMRPAQTDAKRKVPVTIWVAPFIAEHIEKPGSRWIKRIEDYLRRAVRRNKS